MPIPDRGSAQMSSHQELDLSAATAFASQQAFEDTATTPGANGIRIYAPDRFVARTQQRASDMSLDLLTSVLLGAVAALPSTAEEEPDLGLTSVSAIALGGQESPAENTNQARRALLRTTCEHLLSHTGADGTPFGGLRRVGDIIVLPFPPPPTTIAPPSAAQLTGKKRGPPSEVGENSVDSFGSDQGNALSDAAHGDMEAGPLRTAVTPVKQVKLAFGYVVSDRGNLFVSEQHTHTALGCNDFHEVHSLGR